MFGAKTTEKNGRKIPFFVGNCQSHRGAIDFPANSVTFRADMIMRVNKEWGVFGWAVLCTLGLAIPAAAQKTHHRPWFSRKAATELETWNAPAPVHGAGLDAEKTPASSSEGPQIVKQAMHYKGSKYRFGGDSKYKGFDCSGLVERVYNDLNLKKLPHTSSALYQMGRPVHLSELRPGDLLFFKNTYRQGISHVGVYAGHNRFIHAENRRHGVTLTLLSDPYFQLHYAGARRLY
jgi:cell wall-associated NlpC family hydrolase